MTVAPGMSGRAPGDGRTNRFTVVGVSATLLVVAAASAAVLINYGFDLNIAVLASASDTGVFGALVDIAVATAAVAAWVVTARARPARSTAAVLAALLTFLAVDQAIALHAHVPHWPAFYLPVLLASFGCLAVIASGAPGFPAARADQGAGRAVIQRLVGVGLVVLLFSFLLHIFDERGLTGLGVSSPSGWGYQVVAIVKHGTEVAGWLLIALGLFRLGLPGRRPAPTVNGRIPPSPG
jgi:hypothetical protein